MEPSSPEALLLSSSRRAPTPYDEYVRLEGSADLVPPETKPVTAKPGHLPTDAGRGNRRSFRRMISEAFGLARSFEPPASASPSPAKAPVNTGGVALSPPGVSVAAHGAMVRHREVE